MYKTENVNNSGIIRGIEHDIEQPKIENTFMWNLEKLYFKTF